MQLASTGWCPAGMPQVHQLENMQAAVQSTGTPGCTDHCRLIIRTPQSPGVGGRVCNQLLSNRCPAGDSAVRRVSATVGMALFSRWSFCPISVSVLTAAGSCCSLLHPCRQAGVDPAAGCADISQWDAKTTESGAAGACCGMLPTAGWRSCTCKAWNKLSEKQHRL